MSLGLEILLLSIFGSLGVLLRNFSEKFFTSSSAASIPWSTLVINVVASFLAALLLGCAKNRGFSPDLSRVLIVGFCGGLSTFSALSLQLFHLIEARNFVSAGLYLFLSVLIGILAAFTGLRIVSL